MLSNNHKTLGVNIQKHEIIIKIVIVRETDDHA